MPEVQPGVHGHGEQPLVVGRYALFKELAAGGMATVHLGRLLGPVGFSRTIAVKRLHPQFAKDPDFVSMFLDEANLVSRIRHPNVVPTLDVVNAPERGLLLVMEYVHGDSLSRLARKCRDAHMLVPPRIAAGIMSNVLLGLHAAHEARGNSGELLDIVHRDVSPQNVLVGADGVARVLDFGVAKAAGRAQTTREGQVKGKLAYMAPEQISGKVDRRTDIFAAGIVLWELLAGRRMFEGDGEGQIIARLLSAQFQPPSAFVPELPPALVAIVMRALAAQPDARFATAKEMALAIEKNVGVASPSEIGDFVESLSHAELAERSQYIEHMERASNGLSPTRTDPPPSTAQAHAQSGRFPIGAPAEGFDVEFTREVSTNAHSKSAVSITGAGVPSARAWVIVAAVAGIALLGIALIAVGIVNFRMKHADGAVAPVDSVISPPGPASGSAAPPSNAVTTVTTAPTATTVTTATASAPPSPSASVAPPVTAASPPVAAVAKPPAPVFTQQAPRPSPPPSPPPSPKPKSCDPPYTLDGQGHKHYKPECPLE